MMLAQQAPAVAPEIAWSSFAPELAVAAAVLVLLLMSIAGRLRMLVAVPAGLIAAGAGVGMIALADNAVLPGVIAIALGGTLIALTVGFGSTPRLLHPWVAGLAFLAAIVLTFWQYATALAPPDGPVAASVAMQGSVAVDGIALFTRLTVYTAGLLILPIGHGYLGDRRIDGPEFEPLLLLAATGMALLGAANDLIMVFVALEILSISLYILSGLARRDRRSQEAGLKYFVLGAVTSAILLYGLALVYTATGSLELAGIARAFGLVTTSGELAALGLALVTVGLGFKAALVPFHLWIPDVYQGAPTNVTAFMAAATKAAAFAAVLRLFLLAFGALQDLWVPVLAVLATATMIYGAVVAIVQRDVKRILAYSSLAHAGYAAIGVASASAQGLSSTLWYLVTYAVTVMAAFGAVVALERERQGEIALIDLRGLGRRSPTLAGIFTLALLSLAGIPPTAGFTGKLAVFQAGVAADLEWLVVIGVATSAIAAFFYLRLMGMMFLEEPGELTTEPVVSTGLSFGISIAAALVIYLGVQPQVLLEIAQQTAVIAR